MMYLYNGIKLPDINAVWTDKDKYHYATIRKEIGYRDYTLTLTKYKPSIRSSDTNFINYALPYADCFWKEGDKEWTLYREYGTDYELGGFFDRMSDIVWSNYDIYKADGSLYLAASDPVPVLPDPVPETDLTNIDLYRKINGKPTKLTLYKKLGGKLIPLDEHTKEVKT